MSKQEYRFGANILENLTTGMYQDSKVIYREYIQNSCDAIDEAVKCGLLSDKLSRRIEIWLDAETRTISIEDNGTGIPAIKFQDALGNIADSNKRIGESKGFRGIGRLCGLAYCEEVVFSSSVKGEDVVSKMRVNAKKMRHLLSENTKGNKLSANEVLKEIIMYSSEKTKDVDVHFFKVEMLGISSENTDLLDDKMMREYLSFVAPVPYASQFVYRDEINKHAKQKGIPIDEYTVKLDGRQILKGYSTRLKNTEGGETYDEIFGIHCEDFYDKDGNLIAWMWVGLSELQKAIPSVNKMRGFRLRKENIQIGNENALQKLFKEDRGNNYFVGEVFAISNELVPNSQRDYFNENPIRVHFDNTLKKFFRDELHNLYHSANRIKNANKKLAAFEKAQSDFVTKENQIGFVSDDHRERELEKIEQAKKAAEDAQKEKDRIKQKVGESENNPMARVVKRIEDKSDFKPLPLEATPKTKPPTPSKSTRRVDKLSQYNKNERKLISKIYDLIHTATDNETAEGIISKIEEGLQK